MFRTAFLSSSAAADDEDTSHDLVGLHVAPSRPDDIAKPLSSATISAMIR
jgi:hypothetical protein